MLYHSFKASASASASVSDFSSLKPSSGLFWTAMSDQLEPEELFVHPQHGCVFIHWDV